MFSALSVADYEAFDLYRDLTRPIVRDVLGPQFVFDIRRPKLTYDDATRLLDKLDVIHRNQPRGDQKATQGNDREDGE